MSRFVDPGKYRLILGGGGPGAEPSLIVRRVWLGDGGAYCCLGPDGGHPLHCTNITVLVAVQSIRILAPRDVIQEGSEVRVVCVAEGSKPAPDIRWFKTVAAGFSELRGAVSDRVWAYSTVTRRSELTLTVARDDHWSSYRCQATLAVCTVHRQWTPDVHLSLMQPWLQINSTKYTAGHLAHFRCVTSGSRPAAQVTWLLDGQSVGGSDDVS
ncbi:hypothetical protein ACOMHN_049122 [Nucella lapillus]